MNQNFPLILYDFKGIVALESSNQKVLTDGLHKGCPYQVFKSHSSIYLNAD